MIFCFFCLAFIDSRLVQTSPDRVREMIHRFNDMGMRSLDPMWAGGRPRRITTEDEEFIVKTAKQRPEKVGRAFSHWSVRKLREYLENNSVRKVVIGRERLRQILDRHEVTFQRTKTWKESNDPLKEAKLDRIEPPIEIIQPPSDLVVAGLNGTRVDLDQQFGYPGLDPCLRLTSNNCAFILLSNLHFIRSGF